MSWSAQIQICKLKQLKYERATRNFYAPSASADVGVTQCQ